jgi:hypothetical protein
MTALADVLDGTVGSGVYELDGTDDTSAIGEQVTRLGWRFFYLDGADARDKASFLRAVAAACDFPDWFGSNWDALADCLSDLSWAPAPGYVLLYDHHDAYAPAPEWPMVLDIFAATARRWDRADVPFCVLLR